MPLDYYIDDDEEFIVLCPMHAENRRMDGQMCEYQCEADATDECQDCMDNRESYGGEGDE